MKETRQATGRTDTNRSHRQVGEQEMGREAGNGQVTIPQTDSMRETRPATGRTDTNRSQRQAGEQETGREAEERPMGD